jgi:bacterioferritin
MQTASPSASCNWVASPISRHLRERSHAGYDESTDLQAMVRANLVAERIAVESYRQMINLIGDKDPTTRRMLEDILSDEEEHADELKDWLGH